LRSMGYVDSNPILITERESAERLSERRSAVEIKIGMTVAPNCVRFSFPGKRLLKSRIQWSFQMVEELSATLMMRIDECVLGLPM